MNSSYLGRKIVQNFDYVKKKTKNFPVKGKSFLYVYVC